MKNKKNMITIGGRLIKDLLENPRIIRDGESNKIWILPVVDKIGDNFIIISENNETKEQIWSEVFETSDINDPEFLVMMPIEEITPEFLIDLVGDNLVELTLTDRSGVDYWVTRLYKENPISEEGIKEIISYKSLCFEQNEDKHCYASETDTPHSLAYLTSLVSIDLASEKQIKYYNKFFEEKN